VKARAALALLSALLVGGCDVSMTAQPKYTTYAPSQLWSDGSSARSLPAGVVSQDDAERTRIAANPPRVTDAFIARGRERFDIFCSPCHGLDGAADGVIVQHGFPKPPSFHDDKLLAMPARQIFDTISNGYGVMFAYGDRVEVNDRWAIVAYIRALQLSQRAKVADIPQVREKLP
jgi:mono/diheme cytochrome c family protein